MSESSSSAATPSSAPSTTSITSAASAQVSKLAQIAQMQTYVSGVQGFFEDVLADLMLQQPEDPHAFMLQALNNMSVNQRREIAEQIRRQDLRKNHHEDAGYNRAKHAVIVLLTLVANDSDPKCKTSVIATLQELQKAARGMPACLRYDICHQPDSTEILVNQTWATQAGLEAFYACPEFTRATPKFAGMLAATPEEKVYHPV